MQAFASDIDGTLVFDRHIHQNDKQAIKEYRKNHLFGICSGRPVCALFDLEGIDFDFYILSSGAYIVDKNFHVLDAHPLNNQIVKRLFDEYHKDADVVIQTDNQDVFYATFYEDNSKLKVISSLEEIGNQAIYGISLIFEDDIQTNLVIQQIHQKYKEVNAFQNKNSIDIVCKDCSKGTGIKFIKEYFHINEMRGIGDSYNDIPLFQACDYSFTFHSSPLFVKEQVNACVNSVAEAIVRLEEEK